MEESKKAKKTESIGLVELHGTYHCKACLNQKITVKEAVQVLYHTNMCSVY